MQHKVALKTFCLLFLLITPLASADLEESPSPPEGSSASVEKKVEFNPVSVFFETGYANISQSGSKLSAVEMGLGLSYSFTSKINVLVGLRQGSTLAGFNSLYTELEGSLGYALLGENRRQTETLSLNGSTTIKKQSYLRPSLLALVSIKEYFFSGSTSTVTLAGFGGSVIYNFPSSTSMAFHLGLGIDYAGGQTIKILNFRPFLGLSLSI